MFKFRFWSLCVCAHRQDPPRGKSAQKKEKQVKRQEGNGSPTANPGPSHPADPQRMQVEVEEQVEEVMWGEGQARSPKSPDLSNTTHPALLPTTAPQGVSRSPSPPGFIPQTLHEPSGSSATPTPTPEAATPPTGAQQRVKWLSWSWHRRLCFTSRVDQVCPCSGKPSLTPWRRNATPGSTSAEGPNLDARWWTEPPPSHGRGCPATQDWRHLRRIHRKWRQRLVSASRLTPPKRWGTTSPPTRGAIPRAASRWRSPWWRVARNGWRDAATPQQNQTLTSCCLLKNLTSDSDCKRKQNTRHVTAAETRNTSWDFTAAFTVRTKTLNSTP